MSLEKQQFIESKFLSVFNDKSFKEILSKEDYNKYIEAKKTVFFNQVFSFIIKYILLSYNRTVIGTMQGIMANIFQ